MFRPSTRILTMLNYNEEGAFLRDAIIKKEFSKMNDMQFSAVTQTDGPLLILAGAGSGKTTVLVNRIAYLIKYGKAYNNKSFIRPVSKEDIELMKRYLDSDETVYPFISDMLAVDAPRAWEIMAITFTNKAASELKERLERMLGDNGLNVWASTFHSSCVRMLRRDGACLGFSSHFTIYDTDDSKRVIKECQRLLGIDDKFLPYKTIMNEISRAKDSLISAEEYEKENASDVRLAKIASVYKKYQELLKQSDAMDFDDLIFNTVRMLKKNADAREFYQRKFKYVMVDEYQDTNHAQYVLTSLLAGGYNNLCVVGDDDQSIYRFRGATIENILSFEFQYKNAYTVRLEQNYRSTQNILDAANAVIANNTERKGKNLWTDNGRGDKIKIKTSPDDMSEGMYIAGAIMDSASAGKKWSDHAVLYRMNAQSNIIERQLVRSAIPYRIIGGHRFYERKEIKDATAYLTVICNPGDSVRLRRIINEPKRGIGETTVNNAARISDALNISLFDVISSSGDYPVLSRAKTKLADFTNTMKELIALKDNVSMTELLDIVLEKTGYLKSLENDPETMEDRIANLNELSSNLQRYSDENGDDATLEGFLDEVSLMSDIDNFNADNDAVVLMTLHSAKGLEFPVVFLAGMENGIFPSQQAMFSQSDMEEERRLAYVGITRAKEKLFMTNAKSRMLHGQTMYNRPSDFISEIPDELKDEEKTANPFGSFASFGSSSLDTTDGRGYYPYTYSKGENKPLYSQSAFSSSQSGQASSSSSYSSSAYSPASRPSKSENKMSGIDIFSLKSGDSIRHKKFGDGMIIGKEKMGNDVLLEVVFEKVGTKKIMAKVAPIEKI